MTRIRKLVTYPSKRKIGRIAHARLPVHMTADCGVVSGSRFAGLGRGERGGEIVPGSRFAGYIASRGQS